MTLQEAKDQIAKRHHWDDWASMRMRNTGIDEGVWEIFMNEVAHLVHSEACREQREIFEAETKALRVVADVAATCVIDLNSNLNDAGYTEKHQIFEFPVKPKEAEKEIKRP